MSLLLPAAALAREYLNGFDLFSNCNKLQIEFAWTSKLLVVRNDIRKCWDYTRDSQQQAEVSYNDSGFSQMSSEACYQNYNAPQVSFNMQLQQNIPSMIAFSNVQQYCVPNILIISGLDGNSSNTIKLFNLISLFGNISKIQFLPNQLGTAIVQTFDQMSAECCIRHLDNAQVGQYSKINVFWSDQAYQPCGVGIFRLADGTLSFQDFTESKNQRFLIPRPAYWIQEPSSVVRFYNTPPHMNKELLMDVFNSHNVKPIEVKFFKVDEGSRSSRGLMEFESIPKAIQAIMLCNNKEIKSLANATHFMKLCFSTPYYD